jgi:hypothetical protein
MSDQQPATKQDLANLETRLTATLADFETRLTAAFTTALAETEHRLQAHASQAAADAETRIVRAFMGIAETQASRSRELELSRERMLERLAATEGRLLELERRVYGKTS